MPRFVQHVGPKVSEALSLWSKSTSNTSHDPRDRSKTSKTAAASKSKIPFAKYRVGSGSCESYNDAHAQPHGESYTLDELETSRAQTETTSPPSQAPGAGITTRRDDSEHGHQGFQGVSSPEQQSTWAEATSLDKSHRTSCSHRGFEQVRRYEVYDGTQCSTHRNHIPTNAVNQCPQPHRPSQPLHKPHPRPRATDTSPPRWKPSGVYPSSTHTHDTAPTARQDGSRKQLSASELTPFFFCARYGQSLRRIRGRIQAFSAFHAITCDAKELYLLKRCIQSSRYFRTWRSTSRLRRALTVFALSTASLANSHA